MRIELEMKLGYAIPDELNNLLCEDEKKFSDLGFFRILRDGYKNGDGIFRFSTYQTFWEDNEYRDYLEDFQTMFELEENYVQAEYLYIIGETNGGCICMALNDTHKGKIYIADNGDFGITFQANTLQEFLDSLYPIEDDNICSFEELENSVKEKDLYLLKNLIENKGGNLVLYRSSYDDIRLFDLAYNNRDFEILNYLMSKSFYGFNRAEKYGLLNK